MCYHERTVGLPISGDAVSRCGPYKPRKKQPGVFKVGDRVYHTGFHSWGKILRACDVPSFRKDGWIVRAESDGEEKTWTVLNMQHA